MDLDSSRAAGANHASEVIVSLGRSVLPFHKPRGGQNRKAQSADQHIDEPNTQYQTSHHNYASQMHMSAARGVRLSYFPVSLFAKDLLLGVKDNMSLVKLKYQQFERLRRSAVPAVPLTYVQRVAVYPPPEERWHEVT